MSSKLHPESKMTLEVLDLWHHVRMDAGVDVYEELARRAPIDWENESAEYVLVTRDQLLKALSDMEDDGFKPLEELRDLRDLVASLSHDVYVNVQML